MRVAEERAMRARTKPGLAANTFPEIRRGTKIAAELLDEDVKVQGERWEQGHLIEAVMADFLTLPHDDQVRRVQRGQKVVVALMAREKPGAPLSLADAPPVIDAARKSPSSARYSLDRAADEEDDTAKGNDVGGRPRRRK